MAESSRSIIIIINISIWHGEKEKERKKGERIARALHVYYIHKCVYARYIVTQIKDAMPKLIHEIVQPKEHNSTNNNNKENKIKIPFCIGFDEYNKSVEE